jgi:hypothetical protein
MYSHWDEIIWFISADFLGDVNRSYLVDFKSQSAPLGSATSN